MKKNPLLIFALGIGLPVFAQTDMNIQLSKKSNSVLSTQESFAGPLKLAEKKSPLAVTNFAVSVVPIGMSANLNGVSLGPRTNIWTDPNINAVIVSHRLSTVGGLNGNMLGFDISTDGGATFTSNVKCYDPAGTPTGTGGRYPQGAIYNPPGNTTASNAFAAYYAPSLAGTNGASYGGAVTGAVRLDGVGANQVTSYSSKSDYLYETFKITQTGGAIAMCREIDLSVGEYSDTVIVAKGTWNGTTNTYDYTRKRLVFPTGKAGAESLYYGGDVAFANDGMTGFYVNIAHPGFTVNPDTVWMPLVWKTSDGGSTWNYLGAIDINDPSIATVLGLTAGTRFSVAYDIDITVDSKNNLHIITDVVLKGATPFGLSVPPGKWGVFDFHTEDQGVGAVWSACLLGKPLTYRGVFGGLNSETRGQTSRTWAGDKVFFTYFDTDTNVYKTGNTNADAWVSGYDVVSGKWTTTKNATAGTAADAACNFGMVGEYVFGTSGTYEIPIATTLTSATSNVQMNYLDGIEIKDADFSTNGNCTPVVLVGINEKTMLSSTFSVTNNMPNPFSKSTSINVNLSKPSGIILDVINALGQNVMSQKALNVSSGTHTFTIDGNKLSPGIYFYKVTVGDKSITKKMIVIE